ncbi:MAG: fumarylacetoacetate hydrolase family protein [Clostridia bacterium]|nr:fumarylacetoacetate hydrolase family protein [Clostridia bacterium]
MKILRYTYKDACGYGVLQGEDIHPIIGDIFSDFTLSENRIPFKEASLLVPCEPTKIIAVGLNYSEHAKEMQEEQLKDPVLFTKPTTALLPHGGTICRPAVSQRIDYEAELAVVIGKTCKNISAEEAEEFILGYTCLNDVTARDLQKQDGQWTRAKGFDTFAPVGPWIETELDTKNLSIRLEINGEVKQQGNTDMMMFSPQKLVSFVSGIMTLLPGDIITTGTPSGIGPMESGDEVSVIIDKIGTLTNIME